MNTKLETLADKINGYFPDFMRKQFMREIHPEGMHTNDGKCRVSQVNLLRLIEGFDAAIAALRQADQQAQPVAIPEEYPRPIVRHEDGRLGGPHRSECRCEFCGIIGIFSDTSKPLHIPVNLPLVTSPPAQPSREKFTDEWLDNFWQLSECNYRDFGRGIVETVIAADRAIRPAEGMVTGAQLIAAERQRQISVEGWTPEHDAEHTDGALAGAAACYAVSKEVRYLEVGIGWMEVWPTGWDFKPKDRVSDLVRAGALIAAELDRIAASQKENKNG